MAKTQKLYCYVDETGQDTLGQLFIVAVVVVTDERQQELEAALERDSGKQRRKWLKSRDRERQAYIATLTAEKLPAAIFVKNYPVTTSFDELEVLATAQALNVYREDHKITKDYKATVTIDGLSRTTAVRMGSEFRKLGVKTHAKSSAKRTNQARLSVWLTLSPVWYGKLTRDARTTRSWKQSSRKASCCTNYSGNKKTTLPCGRGWENLCLAASRPKG